MGTCFDYDFLIFGSRKSLKAVAHLFKKMPQENADIGIGVVGCLHTVTAIAETPTNLPPVCQEPDLLAYGFRNTATGLDQLADRGEECPDDFNHTEFAERQRRCAKEMCSCRRHYVDE